MSARENIRLIARTPFVEGLMGNILIIGQYFSCPLMLFLLLSCGGDCEIWASSSTDIVYKIVFIF